MSLVTTEEQKEAQRLELMQKLQDESKMVDVAMGKNSLLEDLLACEKADNEEKNKVIRTSKMEVAQVRDQLRALENEKEKKVRQLTSELQVKETEVGRLIKTLERVEKESAKMLDEPKREAKTVRREKIRPNVYTPATMGIAFLCHPSLSFHIHPNTLVIRASSPQRHA